MYKELLLGPISGLPKILVVIALVWTLFWKGIALWRSARNNQKYWFFGLLVINTLGVLEIDYLSFFQKKGKK